MSLSEIVHNLLGDSNADMEETFAAVMAMLDYWADRELDKKVFEAVKEKLEGCYGE